MSARRGSDEEELQAYLLFSLVVGIGSLHLCCKTAPYPTPDRTTERSLFRLQFPILAGRPPLPFHCHLGTSFSALVYRASATTVHAIDVAILHTCPIQPVNCTILDRYVMVP